MENFENLIRELYSKAYLGKCKHFNAARRFKVYKNRTGLPAILINVTLGSVLFADLSNAVPDYIKWLSAFLAFAAALLSGFQTFFNYQKRFEMHSKFGNEMLNIEHKLYKLYQKFKLEKIGIDDALTQYDQLDDHYQSIINESSAFPTQQKDFESALKTKNLKMEKHKDSLLK